METAATIASEASVAAVAQRFHLELSDGREADDCIGAMGKEITREPKLPCNLERDIVVRHGMSFNRLIQVRTVIIRVLEPSKSTFTISFIPVNAYAFDKVGIICVGEDVLGDVLVSEVVARLLFDDDGIQHGGLLSTLTTLPPKKAGARCGSVGYAIE